MGRRGKKRDIVEGPGFRMERVGKVIITDTHRTEEEHREIVRRLAELHKSLPQTIKNDAKELEVLISKFNSFDIIANVTFMNMVTDPETYKEYSHGGMQAYVEYVTLLCLKHPFSQGETRLIEGPDLEDIQSRTREIFDKTVWYYGSEFADPNNLEPPSRLEQFRTDMITNQLLVRNPGYFHHLEEVLRDLFSDRTIAQWMHKKLGFTIDQAIAYVHAIQEMMTSRLWERRDRSREEEKRLRAEARLYRKGKWKEGEWSEELLSVLAGLSEKKMLKHIRSIIAGWTFFTLGETYSFSAEDLAETAKTSVESATRFLEAFSLPFGSVPSEFYMPSATHILQTRPIIHHEGRYLCPVPGMILWGMRPALEDMMNPDSRESMNKNKQLWQKYQAMRGKYLVSESLELLGQCLKHAEIHESVRYSYVEDGELKEADLDGLILLDTALFLVEGKAGRLTPSARRGAPRRMMHDVGKLVADSHSQALRARRYIASNAEPVFTLGDGSEIRIDKDRIEATFLVTVTMDPLDVFTPVLYQVAELGIFEEGDLPWAAYLLDLRVICELTEFPSELVHYLMRRLRINELQIAVAEDELDWFGHYLLEGLYFEKVKESGLDRVQLLSHTTKLDDYYMYVTGERKTPAPKPSQPMPEHWREALANLEAVHPRGYLTATLVLLDMSGKDRKLFSKYVDRRRARSKRDGRVHDFTMLWESGTRRGLTFVCGPAKKAGEVGARMEAYCILKKYQTKSALWIGLYGIADQPGIVHGCLVLSDPWKHDEELEQLVAETLPPSDEYARRMK